MIDDILELIAEIVLDGVIEAGGSKGKAIMIALAALAWFAVAVLLLWVGIAERDTKLMICGTLLMATLAVWLHFKTVRYKKGK